MGCPPEQGHSDAADFSADFLRIFTWLWNTYFSSAKTSKKNLRKICAKMGAKICAPKMCAKMGAEMGAPKICVKMGAKKGAKICTPKICAKNRFEHSVCLEDGSQKKKHKKNLRQTSAKPQPQKFCGKVAEISRIQLLRQERVRILRGSCGNYAETLQKIFCNDPFPKDPISVNCWATPTPYPKLSFPPSEYPYPRALCPKGNLKLGLWNTRRFDRLGWEPPLLRSHPFASGMG